MLDYVVAPGGAFSMYAIVAASGKQFRVSEGDRIVVDRVSADVGQTVRLESVLFLGGDDRPQVGRPFVDGAFLEATVLAHRAGDKVIVFKLKERKRYRRKIGHRQLLSELKIGAIHSPGGEPKATSEPPSEEPAQPAVPEGRGRKSAAQPEKKKIEE